MKVDILWDDELEGLKYLFKKKELSGCEDYIAIACIIEKEYFAWCVPLQFDGEDIERFWQKVNALNISPNALIEMAVVEDESKGPCLLWKYGKKQVYFKF